MLKHRQRLGESPALIFLLLLLILPVPASFNHVAMDARAQQGEAQVRWIISVEAPNTPYTTEEIRGMLNEAYSWLLSQGLEPAPPCDDEGYRVRITSEVGGALAGATYYHYTYDPGTGRVREACISEILLGLYEDPETGNTRENLGQVYDLEARMTIVHELAHAVQAGMLEYARLDPELEKMMAWVEESSSSAIEYFYLGFLDAYMTMGSGYTTTVYSRLAENIMNYFSGALYTINPFEYSLANYDDNYETTYYFAPFFIWLFAEKGFSALEFFYNTSNPTESREVKRLIEEFLHMLPQGFIYQTENKTQVLYPRLVYASQPEFTVRLEPFSSAYFKIGLPPGTYSLSGNLNIDGITHAITYPGSGVTLHNPGEITVAPREEPVLSIVNKLNRPIQVTFTLEYLGPAPETRGVLTLTKEKTVTHTVTETLPVTRTLTQIHTVERTLTLTHTPPTVTITLEKPVTYTVTTTLVKTLEPPPETRTLTTTVTATLERTVTVTTTVPEPPEAQGGGKATETTTVTITREAPRVVDAGYLTLALIIILGAVLAVRAVGR